MRSPKLLLLDTASLYFRAYFGVPDSVRSPDGTPVNAVRGLLDFISRLVNTYQPTHLVCAWDDDWRPAWRVELIPSYKAHRVAGAGQTTVAEMATSASTAGEEAPDDLAIQVPRIIVTLEALGIPIVGHPGFEADDVIGTLATQSEMPVDVVTGDRDLFQLVDDERNVRVLYIARGVSKHEIVDNAWVQGKYGISADRYVDFATLRGDASDGLPGVAGIGDKTAASLINTHGGLEQILAAASRPDSSISGGIRSKLAAGIDYLAVAPTVVSVARDIDLNRSWDSLRMPTAPADPEAFEILTETLGLGSSAERILKSLAIAD